MRLVLFAAWLLAPFIGFGQALRYEISPHFQDDTQRLQVRLSLRGEEDGVTEFILPGEFGPAEQLSNCIKNIACPTRACTLLVNREAGSVVIQHPPKANLELRYEVEQDSPGGDVTTENAFRPVIQPTFFHVLGSALFVVPTFADGSGQATLEWQNFPKNYLIHNSFGSQQQVQNFPFSRSRLLESVFVGGDFRVQKTDVEGRPVWLAIRGDDWSFTDEELMTMLQKTVATQRAFWQDWSIPYYTVTLLPLAQRPVTYGGGQSVLSLEYLGTGLRNSFAAFVTPTPRLQVSDLCHLFHHEMMHHWIGTKIRSGGAMNDMRFGWFIEGFTEYFALMNMLEGGFITTEKYVAALNKDFFQPLYSSPYGELPNDLIANDFFAKQEVAEVAYKRGCVFAFYLDNAMKEASGEKQNLHEFMLDMLAYYAAPNRDLSSNFDFFEEKLSENLQKQVVPLLEKHIWEGKHIAPEEFILPKFFEMETDKNGAPVLHLNKLVAGSEAVIRK